MLRSYLSVGHLQAAVFFAEQARAIEDDPSAHNNMELRARHQHYVTSAVIRGVCAIEAAANEMFADAAHFPILLQQILGKKRLNRLREMWTSAGGKQLSRKRSPLIKASLLLRKAGKKVFPFGPGSVAHEVNMIIELRNALVHADPGLFGPGSRLEPELRSRFAGKSSIGAGQYPICAFYDDGQRWGNPFMDQVLGHGCAEWVVKSCGLFLRDFYGRLGHPDYTSGVGLSYF